MNSLPYMLNYLNISETILSWKQNILCFLGLCFNKNLLTASMAPKIGALASDAFGSQFTSRQVMLILKTFN